MVKLTKRSVDAARPEDKEYFIHDDELSGFGVRVYPSGGKSYLVQYRAKGRSRRVTIGPHGPFTPEQARRAALKLLADIRSGGNPAEERVLRSQEMTIAELCDRYQADVDSGRVRTRRGLPKKASTVVVDRGRIKRHIKPLIGSVLVIDLTKADVETLMHDVEDGKTADDVRTGRYGRAIVRGGPGAARRTVGLLGGILSYAVKLGLRPDNPVHGINKGQDRRVDRYLNPEEYLRLGRALEAGRCNGVNPQAIDAILLLAWTGCRRGEIENLKWAQVDFHRHCLCLEDTKSGQSTRPLGQPALELLTSLKSKAIGSFVFPSDVIDAPYTGLVKAWRKIRKTADLEDVTMHCLRHSFATVAAELEYSDITIAAMLGHSLSTVTSRYTHTVDRAILAAANQVSAVIAARISGEEAWTENVVLLRGSR